MDFADVVAKRRMVRNFSERPVDPEAIERILDYARRGPSAGFTQGQDFIVVTQQELKDAIAELCHEKSYVERGFAPFISGAPVLIIPCTTENAYHRRYQQSDKVREDGSEIDWPVPFWFMDVGCAVMLILLGVVDEGLAAGYAGAMDLDMLRELLNIPAEVTPVGVIPIGHPAPDKRSPSLKRGRRDEKEVVHHEGW
ncbi:MAG: nitroreductase family protein [Chloroflexi bacterium]|nr:nitroreductase family protein [Chloroflexota bacterium]